MPALSDPVLAEDKLPQPFRTIDKILNELIDGAVRICQARDEVLLLQQELEALPVASCRSSQAAEHHIACCSLTEEHCFVLHGGCKVDVLDVQQGQKLWTISSNLNVQCMAAFQQDASCLLALASSTAVELHSVSGSNQADPDPAEPAPQVPLPEDGHHAMAFSPDGTLLAVCSSSTVSLLQVGAASASTPSLQPLQLQLEVGPSQGSINSSSSNSGVEVAWHWANRRSGTATRQHVYGIYGWQQGSSSLQLWAITRSAAPSSSISVSPSPTGFWRLPGTVSASSTSPDGSLLALGMAHGAVMLWDCGLGIPLVLLQVSTQSMACMAFAHDSKQLVLASSDGTIYVIGTSGTYPTRQLVKHFAPPSHILLPGCLEQRAVLVAAWPWEQVPPGAGALVYDLQQGRCVAKLALHNVPRPEVPGAAVAELGQTTHGSDGPSTPPWQRDSIVRCCGSVLLQVCNEGAGGHGARSWVEVLDLEEAAAGHGPCAAASTGALNVQRFLDDIRPANELQQSRGLQMSVSNAASDDSPTWASAGRRDSYASSATGSTGLPDGDRTSAAAPVRVNTLPEDVLEVGAMQHVMEAVALRCGGRRRRERKVRRTIAAMAAELAKQSDYRRTGLGLVVAAQ